MNQTFDFRRWHDEQAAFVMPLRSLVALCRLGATISVEGSGVADGCSDCSNRCSFPSTSEGDVCGGVGLKFGVAEKRLSDNGAASYPGDEVGVSS